MLDPRSTGRRSSRSCSRCSSPRSRSATARGPTATHAGARRVRRRCARTRRRSTRCGRAPSRRAAPGAAGDAALGAHAGRAPFARHGLATRSARRRFDGRDGRRRAHADDGHRRARPGRPAPGSSCVAHRDALGRGRRAPSCRAPRRCSSSRACSRGGRLQRTLDASSPPAAAAPGSRARATLAERLAGRPGRRRARARRPRRRDRAPPVRGRRGRTGDGVGAAAAAPHRRGRRAPGGRHATPAARARRRSGRACAFPVTRRRAGAAGRRAGLPAVLLSASAASAGRPPATPRARARLQALRARRAARAHRARQRGRRSATERLEPRRWSRMRNVLPAWAVRLLVGALLLPPLLVAVDGFARVRRRHEPVGPWVWLAASRPRAPVAARAGLRAGCSGVDRAAARDAAGARSPPARSRSGPPATVALVGRRARRRVLGWIALRPRAAAPDRRRARDASRASGAGAALPGSPGAPWPPCCGCATRTPRRCWCPARTRGCSSSRPRCACAAAARSRSSRSPACCRSLLVACRYAGAARARRRSDFGVVLRAARSPAASSAPLGLALWSLVAGVPASPRCSWRCAAAPSVAAQADRRTITVRGPVSYAGPGSLGGTESALRR